MNDVKLMIAQDSTDGKVVLADGRELQADLIIGADGVHVSIEMIPVCI